VWSNSSDVVNSSADTTLTRPAEGRDRPNWMFVATVTDSNGCVASDTVNIRVITDALVTDTLIVDIPDQGVIDSVFTKDPTSPADDPSNRKKIGVCPSPVSQILLHVPDYKGLRTSWQWQVIPANSSNWQNVDTTGAVYSYQNDTLVIGAPLSIVPLNGSVYRLLSFSGEDGNQDTSIYIEIEISSDDHINTIVAMPTLIDSAKVTTVNISRITTATGSQETEWFKIDRNGNVSPLTSADGFTPPGLTPAGGFNTADHDSLRIFFITKNLCDDTVWSDTVLLRLYTGVIIEWEDTTGSDSCGYEIAVCPGEYDMVLPATIVKGIVDTVIFEAGRNGVFAPLADPFFVEYDSLSVRIRGRLTNSAHNGYKFRAIALASDTTGTGNYRYVDTSCIVTLIVHDSIPSNIELLPDTMLCNGGEINYSINPAPSAEWTTVWYINNDSITADVANYTYTATIADSGKIVMVTLANICGVDTLRQVIRVQTPDTARITITGDTVSCFDAEASFKAVITMASGAAPTDYTVTWYADNRAVIGSGDSISYAGLSKGVHNIWAEATFGASKCISKSVVVSDTVQVEIFGLPSITAEAEPDTIFVGGIAEVYIVERSSGELVWSDSNDVVNPFADTTATRPAEGRDRPNWMFVATVTDSNGCVARDTVWIHIKTALVLDSIFVDRIVTSSIPDEPNDTVPTVIFRNDTAFVKVCPNDYVILTLFCTGDDRPLTYEWHGFTPVERDDENARFTFFMDDKPTNWYCVITDTSGNSVIAYVILEYNPTLELILEANPKMDLGKYYQSQRVEVTVAPARYDVYRFYQYENNVLVKRDSMQIPSCRTAFNYNENRRNENVVFASVTDANHCRIVGSLEIGVLPLPNVMILNDPKHRDDNRIFPNFRITVYNSWGVKMKDRDDGYGWDGTDRTGKQVESGTYFYYVEIKTEKGIETFNGAVTVFKK
jgi:hypothetical protein